GLIPAPDFLAAQARIYALWREGHDTALSEAWEIHRRILPAIVFMSRSPPGMLCYGKRPFEAQAGVAPVLDRAPTLAPSDFGLAETARHRAEIDAALRPVESADA
ncbi:hypothetical protein, partial [Rubrimonas sp.]|uniref:hypothetical protein n=1 Tax=Rubrimonas sp. TaxID=2036015 RepID=UPI002FDE10F0